MTAFIPICALTLAGAIAAMVLRNLVHCALALAVAFAGLALLYLQLDAQFAGFAQILVYIGAVAILVVFAILLTRGSEPEGQPTGSSHWGAGIAAAVLVFLLVGGSLLSSRVLADRPLPPAPAPTMQQLGDQLMTRYILPLEVLGLLLTAALIGAVILAMQDGSTRGTGGAK